MRALIQRVLSASVEVNNSMVGSIGPGICVLVGFHKTDTNDDMEYIIRKLINLRLFSTDEKRWDKSVKDLELEMLCVSQFTLYGELKGNKIDYHNSMKPAEALEMYNGFMNQLRKQYNSDRIQEGSFGEMMKVNIENDGPVTLMLDSHKR